MLPCLMIKEETNGLELVELLKGVMAVNSLNVQGFAEKNAPLVELWFTSVSL